MSTEKKTAQTRFGLIRHGRTRWNREKRIQGWQDSPLTSQGRELARQWGRALTPFGWQRIVHSDLGRARETAQLVNQSLGVTLHADNRLREQDWGEWSGLRLPELRSLHADLVREQEARGWDFQPPGGESRRQVLARNLAALDAAHARWPGQSILLVAHEGVIKGLLYHLLGRSFLPREPRVLRKGYFLHLLTLDEDSGLNLDQAHALTLRDEAES